MLLHAITYNIHGLPWSRADLDKIIYWVLEMRVPVVCFQEVFTQHSRRTIRSRLERHGYVVVLPRDEDVSLFPSGLTTAVLTTHYAILETSFQPFLAYHNIETFANKGFQRITVRDLATGRRLHILNTHTQSDEEVLWWTPYSFRKGIRHQQAAQMIEYCKHFRDPVLVMGDFNQESSLHPHLRTLHPPSALPIRKATFFSTGEDLDHVAWMPLQWSATAETASTTSPSCSFCGKYGPSLEWCKVHEVPWSDHAPVELKVRVPE